eukprot:TRINITY_DN73623_c0_g1_i1.p1 TRINITY_DN73623_c0_g1~~TRINITY_DN73623_c0_g1_i1.p1  ORF type:complete len:229 (+),score=53.80 TRINITY_DN73623_c0_g1_i1:78-764(+)
MFRLAVRRLARRPRTSVQPAAASVQPTAANSNNSLSAKAPQNTADNDAWTEVKDPGSGQSYWWNETTNETTAIGMPKPGPNPWVEARDANGQIYWWNKQTNQTTAVGTERPSALQAAAPQASAPATTGGGLGSALMDGMAWGVGTSLASRMVDGIMGPRQMEVVHRDEGGMDASPPPPGSDAGGGFGGGAWDSESAAGGGEGGGDGGGEGGGFADAFGGFFSGDGDGW